MISNFFLFFYSVYTTEGIAIYLCLNLVLKFPLLSHLLYILLSVMKSIIYVSTSYLFMCSTEFICYSCGFLIIYEPLVVSCKRTSSLLSNCFPVMYLKYNFFDDYIFLKIRRVYFLFLTIWTCLHLIYFHLFARSNSPKCFLCFIRP